MSTQPPPFDSFKPYRRPSRVWRPLLLFVGGGLLVVFGLFTWRSGILPGWIVVVLTPCIFAFLVWLQRPANISTSIEPSYIDIPNWDPSRRDESLAEIHLYVIEEANKAISWYWRRKSAQQIPSRFIRFAAWVLAATAGILPAFATVFKKSLEATHSNANLADPLWASLLLGLAGALVGLDKAFGYSSGWTRFVLTATTLRKSLEEFRLDWTALRAKAGKEPTAETAAPLIDLAKKFRSEIENLVLQETKEWAAEFQGNMAQMERDIAAQLAKLKIQVDKTIKDREAASQPGAIQLTIVNPAKATTGTLKVTLTDSKNQSAQEAVTGSSWAKINVAPGQYHLTVEATVNNQPFIDQKVITVEPGKTASPQVTL